MTNPYNSFNQGSNDFNQIQGQSQAFGQGNEPRPQSYAEYQQQQYANPQQQPFDPFSQQPRAGAPAPYGQHNGVMGIPGQPKSWIATVLLSGFLGMWGAHNFYLGYRNRAITQLVMTIVGYLTAVFIVGFILLGAVAIWAFVDFVRILLRSGEYGVDENGVPLT